VRLLLCVINMFENLTNKFEEIFSSLKKALRLMKIRLMKA